MQHTPLRLGTRGSPLARAQAIEVGDRLKRVHGLNDGDIEIVVIKTTGDAITDRPLSEVGGKGLFTKELETALLSGEIDFAVHSMKDVETVLPDGLGIAAILPREDVRDAFISLEFADLDDLPEGANVGTSSIRRRAQLKRLRPDVHVVDFRGNVGTRLEKLRAGIADATFLACAGLNRLGLSDKITARMDPEMMLPAVAQGAIGIEIRSQDTATREIIAALNDNDTAHCVAAERSFLKGLDGSCRTPIAGLAKVHNGEIVLHGETLSPDGQRHLSITVSGPMNDVVKLGANAAADLIERGAKSLIN